MIKTIFNDISIHTSRQQVVRVNEKANCQIFNLLSRHICEWKSLINLQKKCVNPGVIFGPFEVIWGNFGSFLGHFGLFWVILGPYRAILGHIWAILGHFGSFWAIFGPFRAIFGQICRKFKFVCGIFNPTILAFRMYAADQK